MPDRLTAPRGGAIAARQDAVPDTGGAALRLLGEALGDHNGEVLQRVSAHAGRSGTALGTSARSSLARVCVLSTSALARWIAGESAEHSLSPGGEAWALLQDIAARGSATAADVSARCAQWHAAVSEVLVEQAEFLGTPPQALVKAISMAHTTLAATLARVEEAFGEQALGARPSQPSHERPAARARQASSLRLPAAPRRRAPGARPLHV